MPLDPSIYRNIQQIDPMGAMENGMRMSDMIDQRKIRQQDMQKQQQLDAAYDSRLSGSDFAGLGQKGYAAQKEMKDQDLQQLMKQTQIAGQLAGSVSDQNSYTSFLNEGYKHGLFNPGELPDQYDPNVVKSVQMKSLEFKDHLDQQWKQKGFGLEQKKFGASRDDAERGFELKERELDIQKSKAEKEAAGEGMKMTEAQSKALGFGRRAMLADQMLKQVMNDPNADVTSLKTQVRSNLPKWAGGITDEREQALMGSKLAFVASVLRKESGAAVTPQEFDTYNRMYFPQVGDKPDTLAQKDSLRANFIDTERLTAGPAWKDPIPLPAQGQQDQVAQTGMFGMKTANAAPAPGATPQKPQTVIQNGYTYTLNPQTGQYE